MFCLIWRVTFVGAAVARRGEQFEAGEFAIEGGDNTIEVGRRQQWTARSAGEPLRTAVSSTDKHPHVLCSTSDSCGRCRHYIWQVCTLRLSVKT